LLNLSQKDFTLHCGGKRTNPDELTPVSDSGKWRQPTKMWLERGRIYKWKI